MKKLLLVLAIGTFAACNSGSGDSTTSDSTSTTDTTNTMVAPAPDTANKMMDTTSHMGDTSHMMKKDSTKKM